LQNWDRFDCIELIEQLIDWELDWLSIDHWSINIKGVFREVFSGYFYLYTGLSTCKREIYLNKSRNHRYDYGKLSFCHNQITRLLREVDYNYIHTNREVKITGSYIKPEKEFMNLAPPEHSGYWAPRKIWEVNWEVLVLGNWGTRVLVFPRYHTEA